MELRAVIGALAGLGDCAAAMGCARTGMARPGLVCWLLIFLIKAGSSEAGAPSPGVAAGFAFARNSWRAKRRVTGAEQRGWSVATAYDGDRL